MLFATYKWEIIPKKNLENGHSTFKSILEVSGLPDKLHDKLFDLIGDKTKYQRIGQRKRKRGENGDIPDDLNLMSKYCEIEGGPVDEQFKTISLKLSVYICKIYHSTSNLTNFLFLQSKIK